MSSGSGTARARKQILFVDDDHLLLDGLRDALWSYRNRWTMTFVPSGEKALAALDAQPYDIVVSDLRMPGVDGASLLELVRERCPAAVRIVLSGHAEMKMVARAAAAAHRLIAKPCDTQDLVRVIERSCALQEMAAQVELDQRALGASALPTVPRVCAELTAVLASGTAGAADAARVVEQDMALAAKVLQLANSAYFGRRSPVSGVAEAVSYLGVDALRALAFHAAAFREFRVPEPIPGFDMDELQRHSSRVARVAGALAAEAGADKQAFTAGLLHDVGLLVIASQDPRRLALTFALAGEQDQPIHTVERERYGVTHAEIGAHLLALWGLPHTVTEAVAGHHDGEWRDLTFDAIAAVHVANVLVEELEAESPSGPRTVSPLDLEFLERAQLTERLPAWRELAAEQFD